MMNKKAISELVTAILIILLVLGAIVIVWAVVRTTVETGAGQIESKAECIGITLDITDVDDSGTDLVVDVTRGSGGPEDAVNVVVIVDGVVKSCSSTLSLKQLESGSCTITSTSYTDKVEAAGKIGETACDIVATYP